MASNGDGDQKIMALLAKYDDDGDGKISLREFQTMMAALNPQMFGEAANSRRLMAEVDSNGDGDVDYIELCQWINGGGETPREALSALDVNLQSGRRPRCKYGGDCRRSTASHKAGVCHPGDWDWELEGDEMEGLDPLSSVGGEKEEEGEPGVLRHIGDAPESELVLPDYWARTGAELSKQDVPKEVIQALQELVNKTFKKVKTRDRKEGNMPTGMAIVSVHRVENVPLWRRYANFKYKLGKKRPFKCTPYERIIGDALETSGTPMPGELRESVNEVYLWHGTSSAGATGISETGFRLDLAGSGAGTMYGIGAYLAENSSKSDEYADDDGTETFSLLLCRAVLGQILHLTTGGEATHPMIKAGIDSGSYDSVLGDRAASVGTYEEFVCYSEDQIYPEYVIKYKRVFTDDSAEGDLPDESLPSEVPQKFTAVHATGSEEFRAEYQTSKDLWNGTLLFSTHSTTAPPRLRDWVTPSGAKICADNTRSRWQLIAAESNEVYFEAPYTGPIPPTSGWEITPMYAMQGASMTIEFPRPPPDLRTGYIENVATGLVMDIAGGSRNKGAQIKTWSKNGQTNQLWTLTPDGKIKSHLNGLVLGVGGFRKNRGQQVVTWADGGPDKFWELTSQGVIVSKWCGLAMGIAGASRGRGANIVTWDKSTNWDKVWKFSPHPSA